MCYTIQLLCSLSLFFLTQANVHHHTACSTVGSLEGIIDSLSSTVEELTDLAKQRIAKLEGPICSEHDVFHFTTPISTNATQIKKRTSLPEDCTSIYQQVNQTNGIYKIWPHFLNHPISVYCDMETLGGGWTVIQRRGDFGNPVENFYQTWTAYKTGFGNLTREFWLGNDIIFALTNQNNMVLRIDLEDMEGDQRYAEYDEFLVQSEMELYKMSYKTYRGDAGDSLSTHNNMMFTTRDRDNDKWEQNCATTYKGGWWYNKCHHSNLNGLYLGGSHEESAVGINWYHWKGHKYSLKRSEMKIRPVGFV
uniref:Carcinolectin5b-11 n=1 Tax=Carcinoscorpius rotundicauda TaxID=6848 RepID=A9X704_CARRO|nr:carcinolectin5b-11 [Carcinoscorpius rotundicauda]